MSTKTHFSEVTRARLDEITQEITSHPIKTTLGRGGKPLPDFTDQVLRGCELLDDISTGWDALIDPVTLNLEDPEACILGQTFSDNPEGLPGYNFKVQEYLSVRNLSPGDYGFEFTSAQNYWVVAMTDGGSGIRPLVSAVWEHLTDTWKHEIIRRRVVASRELSVV